MKKPCWNSAYNAKTETLDIILHDVIGFWGDQSADFKKLLNENKKADLLIDINSPGGSVRDGFSMYNSLKSHEGKVFVKVSGLAASIASVIMLAGDVREISENAEVMIHSVRSGAFGTAKEVRKEADNIERLEGKIVHIYDRIISKEKEEIQDMMDAETWFTAEEAVKMGFAHSVCDACESENIYSLEAQNFVNIPDRVKKRFIIEKPSNTKGSAKGLETEVTMDLNQLKAQHPGVYEAAVNEGVKNERDRVCAHLVMGESAGAMDIATKAIKDGEGMTATLQATYMSKGLDKRDLTNRAKDDDPADPGQPEGEGEGEGEPGKEVMNLVTQKLGI